VEEAKRLLFLRGPSTSALAVQAAKDLVLLKKPHVKTLTRKNDVRPFEDAASIEFLAEKNECAAFLYTSHNKKRPHNLVLVRVWLALFSLKESCMAAQALAMISMARVALIMLFTLSPTLICRGASSTLTCWTWLSWALPCMSPLRTLRGPRRR